MDIREQDGLVVLGPPVLDWTNLDQLDCPKCGARNFQSFALQYCKGNLPPDAQIRNVQGDHLGTVPIQCGGVLEEHLHVHCRICHYDRLMQTKDSADRKARARLNAGPLADPEMLPQLVRTFERNSQEDK